MSSQIQNQQAANNADTMNNQNVSGKSKGKQKKKGEKLEVDLYFANTTPNWVSIMEDDTESDVIIPSQYNLPEAPKALFNEIDPSQIPSLPPFKVHLRNLHYEVDKDDLEAFFRNLTIVDIQLIKDRAVRTAWVEFENKQDLTSALNLNNRLLRGRQITMSLDRGNNNNNNNNDRYGDRRGGGRNSGFGGRDNTGSDWRARDQMPPKQVYPPPSVDSYDQMPRTGGYGNRGPRRYGDDDYSSHRNDYGRYDDRGDDRSGYDDRYGRRNDYGNRRLGDSGMAGGGGGGGGNWRRNDNRSTEESNNWRRDAAPQQQQQQHYHHHQQQDYESRGNRRTTRYDDNVSSSAMLPPRMAPDQQQQQQYRNDDAADYQDDLYAPPRNSNQSVDNDLPRSTLRNESNAYDHRSSRSTNEQYYQSNDQTRSGNRNPPLMDHPPRERLSSTRSNVSSVDQHPADDYSSNSSGTTASAATTSAPKERRPLINSSVLDALRKQAAESAQPARVSNYSSIFGEAKPVDTTEKELEIEKKIQISKQAVAAAAEETNKSINAEQQEQQTNEGGDTSDHSDRPVRNEHREYKHRDHQDTIPPRRRANGGIGNRMNVGGGGGGMRRDYDDRNNGALGDRRMGGGMRSGGGSGGGPRMDHGNNGPRMRRNDNYINNNNSGGYNNNNDNRRRYGGGRRNYNDNDNVAPRYQDRGGQQRNYNDNNNDRNRYHSSSSDYFEWSKDDRDSDSKHISYTSTNKFERLGEADDHGSE